MTREIVGNPQIIVACPYCGKEGVADLDKYRSETIPLFQYITPKSQRIRTDSFPDVIPSSERTDQES